jgi:predicted nucleic acid-binding protein
VAYFCRSDEHHAWAVEQWDTLREPVLTCESVVSEALFLLQDERLSARPLLAALDRGLIRLDFQAADHWPALSALIRKYEDQSMSLADASLVRMAELHDACQIFTTDKDFKIYRRHGRQAIPLLAPF